MSSSLNSATLGKIVEPQYIIQLYDVLVSSGESQDEK